MLDAFWGRDTPITRRMARLREGRATRSGCRPLVALRPRGHGARCHA